MDGLTIHDIPERRLPYMIAAFAGWADGAEATTRALRFLNRTLETKKVAEISPEEFYDFTSTRPQTLLDDKGERYISWPSNEFHAYVPDDDSPGLLLFSGIEPNLKWKAYCDTVIAVADRYGVELMVTLGSLFNTVPHTRPFPVSSVVSSQQKLGKRVQAIGAFNSPYQGPTAIHTVLSDFCRQRGLDHVSLWGHGPHYLPSMPNPKLSYTLLDKVRQFLDTDFELEDLRRAGDRFEQKATESIANNEEIVEYVRRLEEAFDASQTPKPLPDDVPTPDEVIRDLEEFLKGERNRFDSD
ncbi:MAG: PAC2 family protein [Dehalococcoidia bacterium]|nr:PAC2 family protein [Dehalococcoidia bacterium]